jgi:hypothetical protein
MADSAFGDVLYSTKKDLLAGNGKNKEEGTFGFLAEISTGNAFFFRSLICLNAPWKMGVCTPEYVI